MKTEKYFVNEDSLTVGKSIITHMETARRMLLGREFNDPQLQNDAIGQAQDIYHLMLNVAGLFVENNSTQILVDYLSSCGVSVPDDFVILREQMENL